MDEEKVYHSLGPVTGNHPGLFYSVYNAKDENPPNQKPHSSSAHISHSTLCLFPGQPAPPYTKAPSAHGDDVANASANAHPFPGSHVHRGTARLSQHSRTGGGRQSHHHQAA